MQLHAIEEVCDLLTPEDSSELVPENNDQLLMALSAAAWSGSDGAATLRLQGHIQQLEWLVLIDSGSSHTFISERLTFYLSGVQVLRQPMTVNVANGQVLKCTHYIPTATWSTSTCDFVAENTTMVKNEYTGKTDGTSLKNPSFFTLPSFDLMVGMDWLQCYSPMKVQQVDGDSLPQFH